MVVIKSSGSMVADMITALTHTIVKHRKIEPLNVEEDENAVALRRDLFFFSFLRKEKPADLDLALMASSIK